jgi:KDO2-lipid IV(A) lauroyltransferase
MRNADSTFDVTFEPLGEEVRAPDALVAATALNAAIEKLVARDPAQYQWEYARFKRPPVGVRSPYREVRLPNRA